MTLMSIYIDVESVSPVGFEIEVEALAEILAKLEPLKRVEYDHLICRIGTEFIRRSRENDREPLLGLALGALWIAFNSPRAPQMPEAVSLMIRRGERATISWRLGREGFGMALASEYVNVAEIQARAPTQSVAYFAPPPEPGPLN
jgi:hypothetical protein